MEMTTPGAHNETSYRAALLAPGLALASPQELYFTYTGFADARGNYLPDLQRVLHIKFDDLNQNGSVELPELSYLSFGQLVISGKMCNTDPYSRDDWCVYHFNYTPGEAPTYSAMDHINWRSWDGGTWIVEGGVKYEGWGTTWGTHEAIYWKPETTYTISAVPEPATYGMLLGGLAMLGFAARRRA